jgi:hypothetical protein
MSAPAPVRREWTPPTPAGNPGQLALPDCEPVDVGRIVKELVTLWAERWEGTANGQTRDFYLRPKRAGEQLLVSFGWRYLPTPPTD